MANNLSDLQLYKHLKTDNRANSLFSSLTNRSFPSPESDIGMNLIR